MNISKKLWVALIIIIIIFIIILAVINSKKEVAQPNVENSAGDAVKNITQTKQGDVEVTDVNITSDGNLTNVSAQVTNSGSKTYSIVDISVVFYDANKTVLSTARGLIENLKPQDKKGFLSSITGDFSKSSSYEVKIEKAQ